MINYVNFLLRHFIKFLRDPNHPDYIVASGRQRIYNVYIYFLPMQFVICMLVLWYPVEIAEKLQLFNKLEEVAHNNGTLNTILSAVILAPIIEEGLFRLWLGYYRQDFYFKWLFYLSALAFGCIHIINYQFDDSHYLFIPFITMTQTFSGLMFGYIRIIYGFRYSVLLHSLFNILGIIWQYTIGFDLWD